MFKENDLCTYRVSLRLLLNYQLYIRFSCMFECVAYVFEEWDEALVAKFEIEYISRNAC